MDRAQGGRRSVRRSAEAGSLYRDRALDARAVRAQRPQHARRGKSSAPGSRTSRTSCRISATTKAAGSRPLGWTNKLVTAFPRSGDQPGATLPRDIGPGPLEQYEEAIAEADQGHDVHEEPGEPRDQAGELESPHDRDGRGASNGRHAPPVAIPKRLGGLAVQPPHH